MKDINKWGKTVPYFNTYAHITFVIFRWMFSLYSIEVKFHQGFFFSFKLTGVVLTHCIFFSRSLVIMRPFHAGNYPNLENDESTGRD